MANDGNRFAHHVRTHELGLGLNCGPDAGRAGPATSVKQHECTGMPELNTPQVTPCHECSSRPARAVPGNLEPGMGLLCAGLARTGPLTENEKPENNAAD